MGYVIAIAVGLFLVVGANFACAEIPSADRAAHTVENLGFHDVRVVDRSPAFEIFGGCRKDDVAKFTVAGVDAAGTHRTIEVCAPVLGGYTVRG